jgi:hypothetical protein
MQTISANSQCPNYIQIIKSKFNNKVRHQIAVACVDDSAVPNFSARDMISGTLIPFIRIKLTVLAFSLLTYAFKAVHCVDNTIFQTHFTVILI